MSTWARACLDLDLGWLCGATPMTCRVPLSSVGSDQVQYIIEYKYRRIHVSKRIHRLNIYTVYTTTRLWHDLQRRQNVQVIIREISQIPPLQLLQQRLDLHRLFSAALLPASRNLLPDLHCPLHTNTLVERAKNSHSYAEREIRRSVLF